MEKTYLYSLYWCNVAYKQWRPPPAWTKWFFSTLPQVCTVKAVCYSNLHVTVLQSAWKMSTDLLYPCLWIYSLWQFSWNYWFCTLYTLKFSKCSNCFSSSWKKVNREVFLKAGTAVLFFLSISVFKNVFSFPLLMLPSVCIVSLQSMTSFSFCWQLTIDTHNIPVDSGRWHPFCLLCSS